MAQDTYTTVAELLADIAAGRPTRAIDPAEVAMVRVWKVELVPRAGGYVAEVTLRPSFSEREFHIEVPTHEAEKLPVGTEIRAPVRHVVFGDVG